MKITQAHGKKLSRQTVMKSIERKRGIVDRMDEFDVCWITGDYDEQECEECPHRHECSGYEGGEDDE